MSFSFSWALVLSLVGLFPGLDGEKGENGREGSIGVSQQFLDSDKPISEVAG
jgi:hypothetical protein